MKARDKRGIGALLAFLAVALLAMLVGGAVYERIERKRDRNRLLQIGLFGGFGWRKKVRTTYEVLRTTFHQATRHRTKYVVRSTCLLLIGERGLHDLLRATRIPAPYILVAERFACFDVRVYNGRYPGDVSAAVLLDPVPDDEVSNPKTRGPLPQFLRYPQNLFAQALNQFGAVRLFGLGTPRRRLGPIPSGFAAQEWALIWALRNEPKTRTALLQEAIPESIAPARAAGSFGDHHQVVVLTSEPGGAMQYDAPAEVAAAIRQVLGR